MNENNISESAHTRTCPHGGGRGVHSWRRPPEKRIDAEQGESNGTLG